MLGFLVSTQPTCLSVDHAGHFHFLKLRSPEPFNDQYLGLFLILINQKLGKTASIDLWERVLGK